MNHIYSAAQTIDTRLAYVFWPRDLNVLFFHCYVMEIFNFKSSIEDI